MRLLPVMDPTFNMREACKQLLLLEDHLHHPRKRCPDCIHKHFLTTEALLEEATGLDRTGEHGGHTMAAAQHVRRLHSEWSARRPPGEVAQEIRGIRKALVPHCTQAPRHYGDTAEEAREGLEARAAAGLAKIYTVGLPVLLGIFILSSWAALKVK